MEHTLLFYSIVAFIFSVITQYLIIDLSHRKGIFIDDHESDLPQKLHTEPTPRIGGLGFFLGLICLMADDTIGRFVLIAAIPAFISGFLEDLYATISPTKRLLIMSFSTFLILYLQNAYVTDFGFFTVPIFVGVLITIIAILGLVNGTNLIDGFNGLSSGVSLIILATFTITALKIGDNSIALVSAISFASLFGFFIFNYPKGKIFLGDGGAYTIGFLLAVIAILIVKNNPTKINPFFALLSLIYPVWEVIFSFTRRIIKKQSPLHPDSKHFHQFVFRTIAKENNALTSAFIFPLVAIFCFLAYLFCNQSFVLASITIIFILVYSILYWILKRNDKSPE